MRTRDLLARLHVTRLSLAAAGLVLVMFVAPTGLAAALGSAGQRDAVLGMVSTTKVFAADGSLVGRLHGEVDRDPVRLSEMPKDLRNAVVSIEDRRFWRHRGVDPRGMARAMLQNLRGDGRLQGGSTIEQQLIKNLYFPGQPRTLWRKMRELVLTLGLEGLSAKRKILEAYLNTVYFGRGVYGVQAAARSYFHKSVWRLTLPESAFLAGLVHMPARYDAANAGTISAAKVHREALARRNLVLRTMSELGYITKDRVRAAIRKPLRIYPSAPNHWRHPYFVDAVLRELGVLSGGRKLDKRFDFLGSTSAERAAAVYRGGLRIYTTMDRVAQNEAARAVKTLLPRGVLPKLGAAVVSVEPGTGYVRALIGGRKYYPAGCDSARAAAVPPPICRHAKVNLALGSLAGGSGRQPGSSFKPFVLAAALEDRVSLRQQVDSSPFTYDIPQSRETWDVENYEGSGGGVISIVDATVRSVNAAFARLEIDFLGDGNGLKGAQKVAKVARRLGIDLPTASQLRKRCGADFQRYGACTPADQVPAIALGAKEVSPLAMAGAYAAFAGEGVYAKPKFVLKITDAAGNVLYRARPERRRAVSRATALGVTHVLQKAVEEGTGRRAALDRPVAGKTGTSQAWRDAWFAGYVPQLTTVVWVGNPVPVRTSSGWTIESMTPSNGYPMKIVGGSYPARIWHADMAASVAKLPVRTFPKAPEKLFGEPKHVEASPAPAEPGGVPGVIGLSSARASIALRRAGFAVAQQMICSSNGGGDGLAVWRQDPPPGSSVPKGSVVTIYTNRAVC